MIRALRGEGAVVEPRGGTFDQDLDAGPRRPSPTRDDPPCEYQRLVVNPFLTILAWIVFGGLLRAIARRQDAAALAADVAVFVLALLLIQFHCLDCGATGWLVQWQQHTCPGVLARWQDRTVRRFHGPRLRIQLIAWFIVMLTTLVLGALALQSRR